MSTVFDLKQSFPELIEASLGTGEKAEDDTPPELKVPKKEKAKGLVQKKRHKKRKQVEDDDDMFSKNDSGKDIIDIGGEKIVLGALG